MSIIIGTSADNVLTGTGSGDLILAGNGDDTVNAGSGSDLVDGGNGSDTINGGDGGDLIGGGNGTDTLNGDAGDDVLDGGNGDDVLNGGSGSDIVLGGRGDDVVIHVAAENAGEFNIYDGGQGDDTLRLVVSASLNSSAAFQSDLAQFQDMIAQFGSATGFFDSLNIWISSFGHIEVVVEGGGNQPPTTAPVTLVAIAEDSGPRLITQAELLVNAADPDSPTLTAVNLQIASGGGTLVSNGDGTWTYTPAADDDGAVSFTYEVTDGSSSVAGTATLDIAAVNDAPTTAPVTLAAIAEDSGPRLITQAELLANASDADGPTLTAVNLQIAAGAGTLVDNNDGTWTYTPAADDDTGVSFTYEVTDGSSSVAGTATLDITPFNDAPTTAPVTLSAIAEDSGPRLITQAELLANASDVDGPTLTAVNLQIASGAGTLVDNNDGTWTYTPAANDDTGVSFTYDVTDGSASAAGTATLDITPVNDAPTVEGQTIGSVQEDQPFVLQTSGQLTSSDPDGGVAAWSIVGGTTSPQTQDFRFQADNLKILKNGNLFFEDTFGDGNPPPSSPFTFPSGPATYTTNGTLTEAAGRALFDGTQAVGFGSPVLAYGERAMLNTNTGTASDPGGLKHNSDFSTEARFDLIVPEDVGDVYGVRLTDQNSTPPNNNSTVELVVARTAAGVRVLLREIDLSTNTVTVLESQNLAVGTNDQIVLRLSYDQNSYINATAGGKVTASFDLLSNDVVTSTTSFAAQGTIFQGEDFTRVQLVGQTAAGSESGVYKLVGTYGTLTLAQDGQWHYFLADQQANVQALGQGQTATDTFTVRVSDGQGGVTDQQIVVTVNGTADPVIAVSDTITMGENDIAVVNVLANDSGTGLTLTAIGPATVNNPFGIPLVLPSLSIVGNQLQVVPGTTFDALGAGQFATLTVPYTVQAADGATATAQATITVNGVNDAPVIEPPAPASPGFTEDSAAILAASGFIDFSDPDLQDTHAVSVSPSTTSGPLSPTLLPFLQNALTATLVDTATGDGHGQYRWDFSLDSSVVQYLGVGQTLTLNYGTTVTDTAPFAGTHASASQNIVVTITGANDAPIAQPDSGQVVEAGTLLNSDQITFGNPAASGNVLLNASDPDFDFISVSGLAAGTTNAPLTGNIGFAVAGTYGALTISPNGIWGYQLDNNNPNTNALAEGQAVTDVFTYTVIDGHGGSANETITINVTGTNDAPVVSAPLKLEVLEGSSSHQLDLLGRASDADGDAIQVASLNIPEGMTSFVSVAADGHTLTFDTNSPDFNILPIGQFSDFVVGYDLVDSHGSVSHQMATFRLVGTDDAPTVSVQNGNAVIEAGGSDPGVAQSQAIITYSDPDVIGTAPNGAPLFQFVAPDTSGWTQNPNGTWSMAGVYGTATWNYGILSYQIDNNDPDTLALGSEDNVYDTFTLTYTDGTLSTSRDVSFEVVGRSDMYGRLVHWEVYFPTKEHSVADDPLWMLDFPQYTTGVSADLVVGDQIELSGDFADADSDLTRDSVITVWDHNGVYAVPKNVLFDIHGHPHVFEGELFNGYLLSGLPTIQSVDVVIPPPGTVPSIEIGSDQQSLWVQSHTGEYPDGLDYYIGDQFVYTITFAPGTPINAPAVNPAPVDVGATNQSIGQTVTIYNGFTLDLNVAYSGTVQFQGPAGTLKFEDTDFSGTVDNFVTNADFLDFSAITQGNATIVGELSGTELAAHSIGWVTNGTDTTVYVNASDQSEALIDADMAIPLLNVSQLHNQDLIV